MGKKKINGRTKRRGFDIVGEKVKDRKLFSGAEISLACEKWLAAKEGISVEQLRTNNVQIMRNKYRKTL